MEKAILTKEDYGSVLSAINTYIDKLTQERENLEVERKQVADNVKNHKNNLLSHRLNVKNLRIYVKTAAKDVRNEERRVEAKRLALQKANEFKEQVVRLIKKLDRMYKSQTVDGKPQQINPSEFILDVEPKEEEEDQLEPLTQELYESLSKGLESQNSEAREESKSIEAEYNGRLAKLQSAIVFLEAHKASLAEAIVRKNDERKKYAAAKFELRKVNGELKEVNGDLSQSSRDVSKAVKSYVKRRPVNPNRYEKYTK